MSRGIFESPHSYRAPCLTSSRKIGPLKQIPIAPHGGPFHVEVQVGYKRRSLCKDSTRLVNYQAPKRLDKILFAAM